MNTTRLLRLRLFLVAVLAIGLASHGFAQRPWVLKQAGYYGTNVRLASSSQSVFVLRDTAFTTSDVATTLRPELSLPPYVRLVGSYYEGSSLAVLQENASSRMRIYFQTPGGLTWIFADSCPSVGREASSLATDGLDYYIATKSNVIYKGGQSWDSLTVGDASTIIYDIQFGQSSGMSDMTWLAYTSKGIYYSLNKGKNWELKSPVDATVNSISYANGQFVAATSKGAFWFDVSTKEWKSIGIWEVPILAPEFMAIASHGTRWYAIGQSGGIRQMYYVTATDSVWHPMGYPLPGVNAIKTPQMMIVDLNNVLVYNATTASDTVNGLYSYDVLDPTDVNEDAVLPFARIERTQDGLMIDAPWSGRHTIGLYDILGGAQWTMEADLNGAVYYMNTPVMGRGPYAVVITNSSKQVFRYSLH